MLKELCQRYTDLTESDIIKLEELCKSLSYIADISEGDTFIDCSTRDPNVAVVVAQAKPRYGKSMYKHSVVGELALRDNEPAALRTLELGVSTRDVKAITQENIMVKQRVSPIKNDNGKTIGALILETDAATDIDQRRKMRVLSETAEQLTMTLLSYQDREDEELAWYLSDAIILFDIDGIVLYGNNIAQKLYAKLGYKDDIIGMHFDNLDLGGNTWVQVVSNQEYKESEIEIGHLSLCVKYISMKNQLFMLIEDKTDVKEKEREIMLKTHVIREIHHRVKNNLQTVASLLSLQSSWINDEDIKRMFNENINRILSIAVTHEILAQSGIDDVDIKNMLEQLKASIDFGQHINVSIEGDSIIIDSDRATSIALVVNELLQNSANHAFSDGESGNIWITIQKDVIYSTIKVVDDGHGYNVEDNKNKSKSLGLKIVKSIVRDKLSGQLQIESSSLGTKISLDFRD